MMNPQIQQYIAQSRRSGMNDTQIRNNLIASHWPEADVNEALTPQPMISKPSPMVYLIQKIAVGVLVVSFTFLTLLSVLAIWDVVSGDVAYKSISTMAVVFFSSIIIIAVTKTLQRNK